MTRARFIDRWIPREGTQERVLEHVDTGQVVTFDDSPEEVHEQAVGLAGLMTPEDLAYWRTKYSDYAIASGGV